MNISRTYEKNMFNFHDRVQDQSYAYGSSFEIDRKSKTFLDKCGSSWDPDALSNENTRLIVIPMVQEKTYIFFDGSHIFSLGSNAILP